MKVFLAKIVSVVQHEYEERDSWVGKYINDVLYAPFGFEFHETIQEAAEEAIEAALCYNSHPRLYSFEEAKHSLVTMMARKHLHGFDKIEFLEVEI